MNYNEVNITKNNISGICNLKCSYSFQYSETNVTAKNNSTNISISYDGSIQSPVTYNDEKYSVFKSYLFSPSLHLFDGSKVDAELIIVHVPDLGGPQLIVSIPIIASTSTSTNNSTELLTHLINDSSAYLPNQNESYILNIPNFSLQHIVPQRSFISYTGKYHNQTANFIVFSKSDCIPLSDTTLNKLKRIINPANDIMIGGDLFFNSIGPNPDLQQEGIYISCKPTGSSDKNENVTNKTDKTSEFNFSNPLFVNSLYIIISFIVILVVFFILNLTYNTLVK